MNSVSFAMRDSLTMLGRTLRHILRNPAALLGSVVTPIFILLMMVYVFGGAMRVGSTGQTEAIYINYMLPGMLFITIIQATGIVAVRINTDMRQGIIARFRTMSVARTAVLNGHVGGGVLGILLSLGVVIGLGVLLGFRPVADLGAWLAALGVLTLFAVAVSWLAVGLGLTIKSPDGVSSALLPLYLLPYFSSAFVPTDTMPAAMAWFAHYQPFTPIIDTVRGLLLGIPTSNSATIAVAWCVGITLVGYLGARAMYERDHTP
ncbi:MAG: ABC transporter permease [Blastochloris sp.]|nr:ABC transporter permease [Blastochloris sp.]